MKGLTLEEQKDKFDKDLDDLEEALIKKQRK